ncbi:TraB/GumN family protein [Fredinandcohnia sp. 179-A 10B2 NHS]
MFLLRFKLKSYFVVVGAAHYTSETGIDNLLEEKGYKIK